VSLLTTEGALVTTHDPEGVLPDGLHAEQCEDLYVALQGAEAVVVAVEWPAYLEIDWVRAAAGMAPGALVFDGRNCLDRAQIEAAGLSYSGVGRPE
jgi:UDPglucose 6-dehydrogenase